MTRTGKLNIKTKEGKGVFTLALGTLDPDKNHMAYGTLEILG